jgi:serine/threonine protein kinase
LCIDHLSCSDGLRLLRTLFSLAPAALGHAPRFGHTLHTATNTYSLSRVLGCGGSGAVFAATGARIQPAIKLKSLGARADGQLEREIEALKMISADCIHLPKVVESGDIYGEAFIVFKAHGIPLLYATNKWNKAERVKRLPLLAHSLTSALTAAHAHGVCHADLRPDNIVVINGVFTLIDFGLSVATGDRILHRRSHSALAY